MGKYMIEFYFAVKTILLIMGLVFVTAYAIYKWFH